MAHRRRAAIATLLGSTTNTVIVSVQALLLAPLYLHFVGSRLYGSWLASGELLVWMQAFDLGLPNLLIQRIGAADGAGDDKTSGEYFATGTLVLLLLSLTCLGAVLVLSFFVPGWLKLDASEARQLSACFQIAAVPTAALLLNNSVVGLSRALQDTSWMNGCVVISGLVGFAVSAILVFMGFGLKAIPLGMSARALIVVAGSLVFLWFRVRPSIWRNFRLSRRALVDFGRAVPSTTCAGIAYTSLTQSDSVLTGLVLGPEAVPIFVLTRKGADLIRSVLDSISYSTYAGFSHLLGSDDQSRARQIYEEVASIRLSLAVAATAAFVAANRQLVSVWVGPEQFGGYLLTLLIALHSIVAGTSYLMNSLYRATGAVVRGSLMLVIESAVRIPLVVLGMATLGLIGAPIAGLMTASISALVVYRWTTARLGADALESESSLLLVVQGAILCTGALVALVPDTPSWLSVLLRGVSVWTLGVAALLWADPALARAVASFKHWYINRIRPNAAAA